MRKPARPPLVLAKSLQHPSVLVSQDLAGRGGTGQDGAGRDGCSHSVPIRKQDRCSLACAWRQPAHKAGTATREAVTDDRDVQLVPDHLGGEEMTVMGALQVRCVVLILATTGVI